MFKWMYLIAFTLFFTACGPDNINVGGPQSQLASDKTKSMVSIPLEQTTLKVMTYNIQAIPCFGDDSLLQKLAIQIYGKRCPVDNWYTQNTKYRLQQIKNRIYAMGSESPDVIFFQEVFLSQSGLFEDGPQLDLSYMAGYKYIAWGPVSKVVSIEYINSDFTLRDIMSSGLLILSKYPLTNIQRTYYSDCALDDCQASKGLLKATIQIPGKNNRKLEIDIFNSHLQAQKENEYDLIRIQQLREAQDFHDRASLQPMQIFGGDFNIRLNEQTYPSYTEFKELFSTFKDSSLICSASAPNCRFSSTTTNAQKKGDILDHVFYSNTSHEKSLEPVFVDVLNFEDNGKQLSDHRPVMVEYEINW